MSTGMQRPSRIFVLYNTDYDAELTGPGTGIDVSSVETSARSVSRALVESGYQVEVHGVQGRDVLDVLAAMRRGKPDLVFNLCESMAGDARNEPTLVGLLDLFELPYTGADLLGLASCLYKQRAKAILIGCGVPTPPYLFLPDLAALDAPALADAALDYPWFVKLAHEDASVGITEANVVHSSAELRARAAELIEHHAQPVLAERYVEGREINVTMIGNGPDLELLPLHEIDFAAMPADRPKIVSYAAKWDETHVDYAGTKPVLLRNASPELTEEIERVARAAWNALGLRDYGRVDLRVDAAGRPWVIDVNPNCDISPDAGVARSASALGISYIQLIGKLTELAWRRVRSTRTRRSTR